MAVKYSFERADLDSSESLIAGLWAQGLLGLVDSVAKEKYQQFYLDNPAGRGDCILLVDASSGQAVGVQGFVPRRFWRGTRKADAAVMADFIVVPEHRSLGPALKLMRAGIELGKQRFAFFYGTPNEKSLAIVRRAALKSIGRMTRHNKLLRTTDYLRRRIPSWMVPPAAFAGDLALLATDFVYGWSHGDPYRWNDTSEFGPEIDRIWQDRTEDRVYGDRSRAMLAWRYRSAPEGTPWRISVASDSAGKPVGYVVWRVLDATVMISDFLVPLGERSLNVFLRSFAWYSRRLKVDRVSLEFFGGDDLVASIWKAGFRARESFPIAYFEHGSGNLSISQATAYMTSFDRDHEQ